MNRPPATVMFHVVFNFGVAHVIAIDDGFVVGVLFHVSWLGDVPDFAHKQCDCRCNDVIVDVTM